MACPEPTAQTPKRHNVGCWRFARLAGAGIAGAILAGWGPGSTAFAAPLHADPSGACHLGWLEAVLQCHAVAGGAAFTFPAFASLPPIEVRTLFIGLHLLGLSLGLGGATMLDFWIFRWMRWGYLPPDIVRTFGFLSKAVTSGLLLLWMSGLGFLVLFALSSPDKLANPKILAKIVIVVALTVNGAIVHRFLLPYVVSGAARPLLGGLNRGQRIAFVVSGALSAVSWYGAFALGLLREFNGTVAASSLILAWLVAVASLSLATYVGLRVFAVLQAPAGPAGAEPSP